MADSTKPYQTRARFTGPRSIISRTAVFYTLYILGAILLGLAAVFTDPLYVIGAISGILVVGLIFRYPFFGFVLYMIIYILRPGERIPALAPFRTEFVTAILLLLIVAIASAIKGRGVRFPLDNISKAFLLFFLALGFSFVFSEWKMGSYDEIFKFVKIFILYYFIVVFVDTEKRFQVAFWAITLLTCIVGIEAAYNYFTGNYRINQGIMRIGGSTSYGEHSNSMAMYMATTIPFLIYLFIRYRKIALRVLLISLMAVCFVTLIITGSRSGILTFLGILMTYAWFSKKRVAYFAAIIIFSIATWFAMPDQYKMRYGSIVSSDVDGSSQGRLDAWKAGAQMFFEKPLFGVGVGVFPAAYMMRGGIYLSSHSLYVETLATTGIAGAFLWGLFMYRLIKLLAEMRRRWKSPPDLAENILVYRRANYAIIAGLFIGGVFGHILLRDTWYIVAGLVVARHNALVNLYGDEEKDGSAETNS